MEYISNSNLNSNSIYDFNNLTFDFDYKNRFINCLFDNEKNFMFETPFLKVLKPLHISNSKKNIELNKYIILETLNNLENNNEFMIVINKIHEISQENIKKNSKSWFNLELDDFGLDMKVRRPIDSQKNIQFIKIIIGNEQLLLNKINNLEKNTYISMKIKYNGLRVLSDNLIEEWELLDFMTQNDYDKNMIELKSIDIESFIENKLNLYNYKNEEEQLNNNLVVNNERHLNDTQVVNDEKKLNDVQNIMEDKQINNDQQINEELQLQINEELQVNKELEVNEGHQIKIERIMNESNNEKKKYKEKNIKKNNILEKNNKQNIILKNNVKYVKRKHKVLIW